MTQHTYNNNTEQLVNHYVNKTNDNTTIMTHENHTQRQVQKQGNGINGKEISKTTSRGTHITKQQQHKRGEREREKENPQTNKKNKCQTTHQTNREREKDRKTSDEKIKSGFNQLVEDRFGRCSGFYRMGL